MENASAKKAKTENFISKFARFYTPIVVISALVLAIGHSARDTFETLYRPKMQFTPERINEEFFKTFNEEVYAKVDAPVGIALGSVIGDIRSICSVVGMSYLMYDEDEDLFYPSFYSRRNLRGVQ